MEAIAVTGLGVVSALGNDVELYHRRLLQGEVAIQAAPWGDPGERPTTWWGTVTDFDPADWMEPKIEAGTDLFAQFALAATDQAVRQAGLTEMDPLRTAVVHGTSIGGVRAVMKAQHDLDTAGVEALSGKTEIQIWPNMASAQIAMRYRLHGPSLTITTACASALDAIGTAARLIDAGQADVAITGATHGGISLAGGGADGGFVPFFFHTSTLYGMVAPAQSPDRATMPFDVKRNGIVIGEGSAMLVLERPAHARARGVPILGYLRGYGSLADGYHPSSPDPSGQWEARAMELALEDAGLAALEVGALIAHATGTPKGDEAEIRAINTVHGRPGRALPVSSIKGHIGHSGSASGAMAVVTGLLGMADGNFVHTANTDEPEPEARFDVVIGESRQLDYETLQVNSFGFGGQNASLVLSRT